MVEWFQVVQHKSVHPMVRSLNPNDPTTIHDQKPIEQNRTWAGLTLTPLSITATVAISDLMYAEEGR